MITFKKWMQLRETAFTTADIAYYPVRWFPDVIRRSPKVSITPKNSKKKNKRKKS